MTDFVTYVMLMGAISSSGNMPFWSVANQFGLMPETSGGMASVGANCRFDELKDFQWCWGVSLAANVEKDLTNGGAKFNPMIDELYASMRFKKVPIRLDLGMKHQPMEFLASGEDLGQYRNSLGTLSTTGGHIVWSGNARTLPGYSLNLEPLAIPGTKNHLWIYGSFGDYFTLDKRYCQNAMIHSTKAFIRVDFAKHFSFHFGLDHYAVWGGDKCAVVPSFGNYLRVITGRGAGADGTMNDRLNVIGDHGGGELIKFEYQDEKYYAVFQHDIPYADGSGMGFQNFPDGVNTLFFGWKDKNRWVSDILYEFAYTMYQSGPIHGELFDENGNNKTPEGVSTIGIDDYFNNGEYRDGWTYYGRTIGYPMFYTNLKSDKGWTLGVRNNRLIAHHIAISGKFFRKAPYKLLLTYSKNYGIYYNPYTGESAAQKPWGTVKETPYEQFSAGLSGEVKVMSLFEKHNLNVTYGVYSDIGKAIGNSFGATIGLRYSFR